MTQPHGSTGPIVATAVTAEPLDLAAHEAAVRVPEAGAVVSFAGIVRNHDGGRPVTRLVYEAHPTAAAVLADVTAEIAKDPAVYAIAVSHRIGDLGIGDIALAAAISTAHRGDAFTLCARLVDEVKARLPVWKHQLFDDGSDEWVNSA
jgi:molybdopterin synthase catalytic subunit